MRRKDKLAAFGMALYGTVIFCAFLTRGMSSEAVEIPEAEAPAVTMQGPANLSVAPKTEKPVTLTYEIPEVIVPQEAEECAPIDSANVIDNCIITYYCCEKRSHICGTGDGITATGTEATPGRTCAVDPSVIPYGSTVIVDYGDGELHSYIAEDAGAWVAQAHVDICVESHSEALELGRKVATVYWTASGEVVV